ncbi:transcriptional regulator [Streptomyces qinzhouensis]|uniref:Transcriptional regulator n=2 Tax=Streptomyces qinzhouensis TaxID=2599401 RepID=A0A5B8J418_9ACTN|nr:transcriptional regulator [Streptomyces qinzhouensis]QDY76505.1 transcriptional regulator [Streptomyces qinzhouensis]
MGKRESNAGLARLLLETGWTYAQLARSTNRIGTELNTPLRYDESSVNHWIGGTVPRETARRCIVEALSRRLDRCVTYAEAGFPPPKNGQPNTEGDLVEGLIELGRNDMDPSRRGVLGVGLFSVALTVPGWQDVVARAEALNTGKATRIGMPDVEMVRTMTDMVSELDDQYGGRHARPLAATILVNTVADGLRSDAHPEVHKAMMGAASDLCYLTGYMAVDEGLHGLAQRYYLKALELAGGAGDHLTYCTTLRGMSVQAAGLGHGARALNLADAAAAASPAAGPRMRAFLVGQQAHAAAMTGDKTRALREMREAEAALERADSRIAVTGRYDSAALHFHISEMRYALGDVAGSIDSMTRSNQLRFAVYRRSRVRHNGLLAERQFQLGHLEAACQSWKAALSEYPLVQSGRVDDGMRSMVRLTRPHLGNAHVRALHDQARATLPHTMFTRVPRG